MKRFNTTAVCVPEKHYMVDLSGRVERIRLMIERGEYFAVNRGRQYGKTTTLYMIKRLLSEQYAVIFISFEAAADLFVDLRQFAEGFCGMLAEELCGEGSGRLTGVEGSEGALPCEKEEEVVRLLEEPIAERLPLQALRKRIQRLCRMIKKPVVLLIDEVDRSADNDIFITFLGLLRDLYIKRSMGSATTFQSVLLCGMYDVRNLKWKLRPGSEHQGNSPWNIAVPFDERMVTVQSY